MPGFYDSIPFDAASSRFEFVLPRLKSNIYPDNATYAAAYDRRPMHFNPSSCVLMRASVKGNRNYRLHPWHRSFSASRLRFRLIANNRQTDVGHYFIDMSLLIRLVCYCKGLSWLSAKEKPLLYACFDPFVGHFSAALTRREATVERDLVINTNEIIHTVTSWSIVRDVRKPHISPPSYCKSSMQTLATERRTPRLTYDHLLNESMLKVDEASMIFFPGILSRHGLAVLLMGVLVDHMSPLPQFSLSGLSCGWNVPCRNR